jgi:hypothetical protein
MAQHPATSSGPKDTRDPSRRTDREGGEAIVVRWIVSGILAAVAVATGLCLGAALGGDHPSIWRYGQGKLVVGEWAYGFGPNERVLADEGPFTGFAFGPGRSEVAYCGPGVAGERSALWVVSASASFPTTGKWVKKTTAPRRMLWTAQESVVLRGPVWWAPDGSRIGVRACTDTTSDLVVVDYLGGEPVWVTREQTVLDAAWAWGGRRIAYVTDSDGARVVWTQSVPPDGSPRRVGMGGYGLGWTLTGDDLCWISPTSERVWSDMRWSASTGEAAERGQLPPRPAGALWAPNGRVCAVLDGTPGSEDAEVVIFRPHDAVGERPPLPDLRPRELLGWSPDSKLLIVLGDAGFPFAIGVQPPAGPLEELTRPASEYSRERAGILGDPMDSRAGPPAWSSAGDMVAYVVAQDFEQGSGLRPGGHTHWKLSAYHPLGCLIVRDVRREHLTFVGLLREDVRQAVGSLKKIASSMQMYLADNNDAFPMSEDAEQFREVIAEYVRDELAFLCPGSEDEIAIEYLVEPGAKLVDVEDPAAMPVATATCFDDYDIIAYADGHVEVFRR